MRAFGEKALEAFLGSRHRVGFGDADGIKAELARLLGERGADVGGVQKSRSA